MSFPCSVPARPGGLLYYVMPYVEGESLRARLARDGTLEAEAAVRIARDVAEALGYAHSRGVVHRDIKPENMYCRAATPWCSTSALQRRSGPRASRPAHHGRHRVGNAPYMAPEQAAGGGDVDGRADLYALGVVLYECSPADRRSKVTRPTTSSPRTLPTPPNPSGAGAPKLRQPSKPS